MPSRGAVCVGANDIHPPALAAVDLTAVPGRIQTVRFLADASNSRHLLDVPRTGGLQPLQPMEISTNMTLRSAHF
jgi:hypothetical protein